MDKFNERRIAMRRNLIADKKWDKYFETFRMMYVLEMGGNKPLISKKMLNQRPLYCIKLMYSYLAGNFNAYNHRTMTQGEFLGTNNKIKFKK